MRHFFLTILLFVMSAISTGSLAQAQDIDTPTPEVRITTADGITELAPGDEYSGEAPLTVQLTAGADEQAGFTLVCSWEFTREGELEPFLIRYDADVEYVLRESGTIIIQPKIVYTSSSNPEIVWEFGTEDFEPFRIVLAESGIEVPNAFSPNGDGINDYYNVFNVKSIVEFHGAIYNRWGQELYRWGLDEMGREGVGWDGTYKGNPVKPGVYFVVIKAMGADGIEYDIKRDVNLLRGYSEE
jgi:gliding motility-associated-like protein